MQPDTPWKRFLARFRRLPALEPATEGFHEPEQPQEEAPPSPSQEQAPEAPARPEWKDKALLDFAKWLESLPDERVPPCGDAAPEAKDEASPAPACDLYTLLSEFVALRQEIKLQSREQHAAIRAHEQLAEGLLAAVELFQNASRDLDTLSERIRVTAEIQAIEPFFDLRDALSRGLSASMKAVSEVYYFRKSTRERLKGVAEGYELALRRFDRAMGRFQITPIPALGQPFNPAIMRAVGRRTDPSQKNGVVLEEHLGGFMRGSTVLRPAEVVVNG